MGRVLILLMLYSDALRQLLMPRINQLCLLKVLLVLVLLRNFATEGEKLVASLHTRMLIIVFVLNLKLFLICAE